MRFKSFLYMTAAVLPLAIAGCTNSASEFRALQGDSDWTAEELTATPYDRAKKHFAEGRFGLAVKHFEIALSKDTDSVEALNGLAASFDQLQRFELSERFYLRALNLDPKNGQTLNNLGYSYLMQGRYDLALTYLHDAMASDPMNNQVRDNLQQAQAGLELESRDFLASAIGSEEFKDVAAQPRSTTLRTQEKDAAAPQEDGIAAAVHIRALAARDDIWVERSTPAVQSLITRPSPDVLLAMRDAGLPPRIANFRNQSAVTTLQTQSAPWQTTHVMIAEAMVQQELSGAIGEDHLIDDALETPVSTATVAVEMADLPQLSARIIEEAPVGALSELPQLSAAVIEFGPMSDAPAYSSATVVDGPQADGSIGELPQLSAGLADAPHAPVERDGPVTEVEQPVMRQDAVPAYDIVASKSNPLRRKDLPALPPGSDETPVIEVSNGTGRLQMAYRVSEFLKAEGLNVELLTNAEHFRHQETVIFYRREWLARARELAQHLPVEVVLVAAPNQWSDIRIRLGGDLLNFDQGLFYASRESSTQRTG